MFGEKYAQPGDTYDDVAFAFESQHERMPQFSYAIMEVAVDDAPFLWGGVLQDSEGEEFGFDGFETREDAVSWVVNEIGIPEDCIETF